MAFFIEAVHTAHGMKGGHEKLYNMIDNLVIDTASTFGGVCQSCVSE